MLFTLIWRLRNVKCILIIHYKKMSVTLKGYLRDFSLRNILAASHTYKTSGLWKGQELVKL